MAAEQGRFVLWLPVCLGAGVLTYFSALAEPPAWVAPAGLLAALLAAVAGWRRPVPRAAGLAALLAAAGLGAGQLATRRALPLAALPTRAVSVVGVVLGMEVLPDGCRITLADARLGDSPPLARTIRIRLRPASDKPAGTTSPDPAAAAPRAATPRAATPPVAVTSGSAGIQDGARSSSRQSAPCDVTGLHAGDMISLRALLRPPAPPLWPGARDAQREAYFAGTAGSGVALGPVAILATTPPDSWARWWQSVRDRIAARILVDIPGPRGAIAATMLTGAGSAIPEPDRAAFRNSGLAHLLAVAGLHIGIVMGLAMSAARIGLALWEYAALRWPTRQIAALAALAAGGGYALLTGIHLPILRAFAMASLVTLGLMLGRRAVSLRGLAFAATALLLLQPQEIMGVSFRMSFSAVLALIAGYEAARPWLTRLRNGDDAPGLPRRTVSHLVALAFTSLLAGTASAPFAAAAFGQVQLYFIVANMLAVPLTAMCVMPAGLLGLALMPLGLEQLAFLPMGWGVDAILWVGRTVSSWPAATLGVPHIPDAGLMLVTLGLAWLGLWRSSLRLAGIALLAAGLASPLVSRAPDLVVSPDARVVAIHAGGRTFAQSAAGGTHEQEDWTQLWNAAPQPLPDEGEPATGLRCDPDQCVLTRGPLSVALVRPATRPQCGAQLLVSASPLREACPGEPHIDRFTVWREGSQAVWLNAAGVRVVSDRATRGSRAWIPAAPGFRTIALPQAEAE